MGWSEQEVVCKKHPEHRQQPGVCSICLREKLNNLSNSPSPSQMIRTIVAVSSLSSNSSRSSSTSVTPPVHHRRRHRRHASAGGSLGFIITGTGAGNLKKSRSIAFIEEREGKSNKKLVGFWKKLIKSTGKGTKKVFMHSTTVKEERSLVY